MLSWSASNIFDESISLRLVAQQRHGDDGDRLGDHEDHQGDDGGEGGDCEGDHGDTTPPGETPPRHGKRLRLGVGLALGVRSSSAWERPLGPTLTATLPLGRAVVGARQRAGEPAAAHRPVRGQAEPLRGDPAAQ